MTRFRELRGSQQISNFFHEATDLKTPQKQKGARLEAKTQFLHNKFQDCHEDFEPFKTRLNY